MTTAAAVPISSGRVAEPIMARLKRETAEHHLRAERVLVDLMSMASPNREAYVNALWRMAGWYRPMEAHLERMAPCLAEIGLAFDERRKMPMLDADLDALGVVRGLAAESCDNIPAIDTVSHAIGAMYVLEGATLGGQIIVRHLAEPLGLTPACGARFFASYGSRVGPMWREFGRVAEEYLNAESGRADEAVAAACETFESLSRWLEDGRSGSQRRPNHAPRMRRTSAGAKLIATRNTPAPIDQSNAS